jgi:L-rhamnose-H+ transport protein
MHSNPILGVIFHWLGGLASGSFYVPYKGVKKWAWEVYWFVGGVFMWIICPVFFAWLVTKDNNAFAVFSGILKKDGITPFILPYLFGIMWGFGGLTFGLTMRYLGMSLGMGVALSYCAVFGALFPPFLKCFVDFGVLGPAVKKSLVEIAQTPGGIVTLLGNAITIAGIILAAMAGLAKEREMPEAEKKKAIAEFNFKKGILVATFSGIMSAGMAFALTAASPLDTAIKDEGTPELLAGIPSLAVILLGGFTTNFFLCAWLCIKNKTGYQYFARHLRSGHANLAPQNLAQPAAARVADKSLLRIPRMSNYLFAALAGSTWYFQFFFYKMGESQMGDYSFASWTLHMASIIIFSTLWGVYFKEWSGVSKNARTLITIGIATLVFSTIVIGYGTLLDKKPEPASVQSVQSVQSEQSV